jgi:NAD(P)H-flavin reductase/ferredoxin
MHAIVLEGVDDAVPGRPEQSVLDACLAQGLAMPYNCRSGECGECVARLLEGRVHELPGADPATYTEAMRQDGLILACLCFPRSDLRIAVPLRDHASPQIHQFDAVIERVQWHGGRTAQVTVRCPQPVDFRGGQYFEWFPPGGGAPRSYSAANAPGSERLQFLVRLYPGGKVSAMLQRHELAAGDVVTLRGPFGTYEFANDDPMAAVFVAGGTGLAPVLSIVEAALAAGSRRPLRVFYGARDAAEVRCGDALTALAARHPGQLHYVPVLSDEPADSAWTGARGTVVEALEAPGALGDLFGASAYLCGPPAMVDKASALLEARGVMRSDISCDKFVPAHEAAAA